MGVPGLVAWFYKNHKNSNFIFKQLLNTENNLDTNVSEIHHLLIDANCLIHPQAREVCINNPNLVEGSIDLLEKKIIKQIITYIELLIDRTKPTKSIFIAVDGVAPMAKVKHQRLRRFKSVYDRKIKEKIANKHNVTLPKEWNTSAITPGTIFMDKLMKSLLNWVKKSDLKVKIIFSSSYTPGEGEHKLLQYLKSDKVKLDEVTTIYGLDADLLFLALASKRDNLYLMRETSEMEQTYSKTTNDFSYLSIGILKDIIKEEIFSRLDSTRLYNIDNIIDDFVFLCYFCGNDFIPNIPSLSIKPPSNKIAMGIDTILDTYSICLRDLKDISYLIQINESHISLNKDLFLKILDHLSDLETEYYSNLYKNRRYIRHCLDNNPYKIELHNYEENIIDKFYDPIQLGDPSTNLSEWKKRYYKNYYHTENIDNILDEYVNGLIWTTYYYYDKCPDYEWFFHHHHGPFVSDLRDYLKKKPERLNHFEDLYSIGVWFENQIKPLQQLMLVLPHESSFLIPTSYRNLLFSYKLRDYFPTHILDIKMDYLYKNKGWQNIPMIKTISARKIINITSKVVLKEEAERNKLYNEYIKEI
jgi:5'-3' exoribonuclease 1